MSSISALANAHIKGQFGDCENKDEKNLLKISEIKNLLIVQIVQYKNSKFSLDNTNIDSLKLKNQPLSVINNKDTRILWSGPKNWFVVSSKKELLKKILENLNEKDFAVTDISHSRAVIEIEGNDAIEVLKKGCPYNFNTLNKNNSINSVFNGIAFSVDMLENEPIRIRLFALRSFGESFYHSISDASLEYGYIGR